ncbi:hypothetical protein [Acidithiobacillus ferrivorans]|nr:hypothetical protein [Acidithiobacillus ferrivorans]
MSMSSIEALACAWAQIAEEVEFPADYGTPSYRQDGRPAGFRALG